MASQHRVNRVRHLLHRELSTIVMQLKDPRTQMVTVVDAEISRDLRTARMFVSLVGSDEERKEAMAALKNALGFIRKEIAKRVQLRYAPTIDVAYDDTAERAAHITALLDSLTRDGDG